MKKILLFAILLFGAAVYSQDTDTQKLGKILDLLKENQDVKTIDSLSLEIEKFSASDDNAVKIMIPQVKSLLTELKNDNLNKVESKSVSELSKEDLKGFKVEEDKFKEITFISPRQMPKIYTYIGIKKGILNLRLVNYYSEKNWIFWKKAIFLYNGKRFEYTDESVDSNVSSGYVSERSDIKCTPEMIDALREIVKSDKVDVRLEGSKGVDDFSLPGYIKESIAKTLVLYDKLKK